MATLPVFATIRSYNEAVATRDSQAMVSLRSGDCVLDMVCGDAFGAARAVLDPRDFYNCLFEAFPELDFEVKRTVVADTIVLAEWTFRGTNAGTLKPPLFANVQSSKPTGKTVRLRGITVYELSTGLIRRETVYFDYLSLVIELGSVP